MIRKKGRESEAKRIFDKWDLHAEEIGFVTDDSLMRVRENGVTVAEIPAKSLADDAPVYMREEKEPAYLKAARAFDPKSVGSPGDLNAVLLKLLDTPTIASKEWIYHQYDHMVRTNTTVLPGSDASVIRIKGTAKSIAISVDCNSTYCYLDPYEGAKIAVAEAARNVACSGAVPLSITDCLNFGSPMNPEIFWQLKKCVEGIRDACVAFETPVSGGNVSLYNQNLRRRTSAKKIGGLVRTDSPSLCGENPPSTVADEVRAIDPTPVIGMVGLIEGTEPVTSYFKKAGDVIILLGESKEELGGSEYLKTIFNIKSGPVPRLDLGEAKKLVDLLVALSKKRLLASAHDCSEGGLALALAESCILAKGRELGAVITNELGSLSKEAYLFGETQSRVVISVDPENLKNVCEMSESVHVPYRKIGQARGASLEINSWIQVPLVILTATWRNAIKRRMDA
ncbi:MAG: hypothetical protein COT00_01495 [Candidatus Omnitrophica bacterium CG07_land_8_20_14_0_80_50_8]|nr:MAG: hypothetical protein COT00_01495 [Candidatus Omnitrophica bacterium CG07_land_8_20_14_0_80_50_8]